MAIGKYFIIGIFSILSLFVIWMNVTPGHFQGTCTCKVEYLTQEEVDIRMKNLCRVLGACVIPSKNRFFNQVLGFVAILDFNK